MLQLRGTLKISRLGLLIQCHMLQPPEGDYTEAARQPSDPWTIPGAHPWNTAAATRLQFPIHYKTRDFQPSEQNTLELTWTLPRPDLRMPGVPAAGAGRPSVYAGGGSTGEQHGPGQRFPNDNPPSWSWDGKNPQTQAEPYFKKLR